MHVNPYDTGFDENSHVMRFSALAREVQTTAQNKVSFPLLKRQISSQFSALKQAVSGSNKIKVLVPVLPKIDEGKKVRPTSDSDTSSVILVEEELEVVEVNDAEEEEEQDALVEYLFEQLKEYRSRVRTNPLPLTMLTRFSSLRPRCGTRRSKQK